MKRNNLLFKVLFSVAAILFSASAFAIPQDPCVSTEVCCDEPAPGPWAFAYPKDVGLACPRDFYGHGEFLLMKPSEEGLEFAINQDQTGSNNDFPLLNGKLQGFSTGSKEWDWRPGFRVGFGFYPMHDAWNVQAEWTYIRIKAFADISRDGDYLPLFYPPRFNSDRHIPHISARWSGDYTTMDIMMGKPYHVSRYYVSNPMFGVRAGWIDQDLVVNHYEDNSFKYETRLKNDYWGIGIRGYYEGQFLLGSGWSFFGKTAVSLLFGKFDITQANQNFAHSSQYDYDLEDSFYSVQPNAELGMGISWSKFFSKNQNLVSLKIGYEFHHWWDQNQARRFFDSDPTANDTVSRGDLSFNGFMFGLHCEF